MFVVDILYVSRDAVWAEKGKARLSLPAVDLPISRTGLLVYHPLLFKVVAEPGSFRIEPYENPSSTAFNPAFDVGTVSGISLNALKGRIEGQSRSDDKDQAATQVLVEKFHAKSQAGKVAGILPIKVSFPAFGPSIFLVSELTSENQAPTAELNYQRDKKGGSR